MFNRKKLRALGGYCDMLDAEIEIILEHLKLKIDICDECGEMFIGECKKAKVK